MPRSIPIVYEWVCSDCGRRGNALVLVGDNAEDRVRLAHFYARMRGTLPVAHCNPDRLTFALRGFRV